ncbi:protein GFS12 [Syzygium oleosum]|uniref:protein GFS12 n=1 Tax=Syzygium oleosum TaxID=219896 RepID=UPI0011D29E1C|nr:protein GFS12 [Syzygium oleosum]
MESGFCFGCLERRIASDFSGRLVFSHGLADSPLPLGSSAVVQMSSSDGEAPASASASAAASQFVLHYLPARRHACLARYIDEYTEENPQEKNSDEIVSTASSKANKEHDNAALFDNEATEKPPLSGPVSFLKDSGRTSCSGAWGSKCTGCNYSYKYSRDRTITALAPIAYVAPCCYSGFQELASSFLSGSLEDHVLLSLCLLIEGKATGRDSVNFLNLIGVPSYGEDGFPGCLRHPNIAPVLGMLKSSDHINLVLPKTPYTLENILHYSPETLMSEWDIRFVIYQILSGLAYIHGLGITHGNICPSSIMMTKSYWSWISIFDQSSSCLMDGECTTPPNNKFGISCDVDDCACQRLYADLKLSQSVDWHYEFQQWWRGELSNFEYLLILNRLAGRRWGDNTFYPVMPWVIDFSTKPEENSDAGWRDLRKSKWRLAKGDEQLDFTYSTSEIPHHVSDECLSELAVCSYKARRLPLSVLRLAVRSVYEPNEYPSTMQRLYQWTPDECIPEFYFDSQIFHSIHNGMADLSIPSWASSPEEFIKMHRDALESDRVSCQIHNWIDITFGYKMSGEAAVAAKNVMLPSTGPTVPRSAGRRQLFTRPHPMRRAISKKIRYVDNGSSESQWHDNSLLSETVNLHELEEAFAFSEHARHLNPAYCFNEDSNENIPHMEGVVNNSIKELISDVGQKYGVPHSVDLNNLLEHIEVEDESSMGYQEILLWRQKLYLSKTPSSGVGKDIFSVGCVLAELHLRRPLFDPASLAEHLKDGRLPGLLQELPFDTKVIVEACIQHESNRWPSAKALLESPYFPATVKSSYLFISALQLLATDASRLRYLASFAKQGAFKAMGSFAAQKCATYCLPLLVTPSSDTEAEWACIVLKELIKYLTPLALKTTILPSIQKILQTAGNSHLKVSILQDTFVREIWKRVGKDAYLETLHPLVISNLHIAPHKSSAAAAAASVLLIGSSEELGIPISVHQTVLPLIHCFGKGLCPEGIDALVRIGALLGDSFIVRHMLPLLKQVIHSCLNVSCMNKPEPLQSWSGLALVDCLVTLHGLVGFLPKDLVVKELIQDHNCLHVIILMQPNIETSVLQVAASTLLAVCQQIGPDLTAAHVLPQLKELFDELAFSQDTASRVSGSVGRSSKPSRAKIDGQAHIGSRTDLVLLLYPSFASLLGIEKLRQCCATWLLLEQFLLRCHNWKWECTGDLSRSSSENASSKRPFISQGSSSEYSPAKMLLNGVGWSVPQAQGNRGVKNSMPQRRYSRVDETLPDGHVANSSLVHYEHWFWFPSPVISWDGPEFLARMGGLRDEIPWKIRASVIHSVRAHHGALRSLAVCQDESTVYTAGIGPGFKGTVQKWDLTRMNCLSGYYGHEEVVNDICVLSGGLMASCDGNIHVWSSRSGKVTSVFAEGSTDSAHFASPVITASGISNDQINMLNSSTLSSGILTGAFDGSLYTCMHHLEFSENLVAGTGNGSLRFIDVSKGQKLHLWKGESIESGFPSLVSAICSSGSDGRFPKSTSTSPSWIAAGLSSGHCRLFDMRTGDIVASWRAHDGYITKVAALEANLIVSSSLDKTLRVWDMRKNSSSQLAVYRGHTDGVSGFALWGQDVVSISRNKIGLSSLSKSGNEEGVHRIIPQKLHVGDQGTKSPSALSSISILPFSRLFLVGTEDGYLRICC